MKKLLIKIVLVLLVFYLIMRAIRPILPDWVRIILNSDPRYAKEAISEANKAYKYDRRE